VYIKLVVLLRNYVTMMHGQQNIKNGWATIVVVGRLRVKAEWQIVICYAKLALQLINMHFHQVSVFLYVSCNFDNKLQLITSPSNIYAVFLMKMRCTYFPNKDKAHEIRFLCLPVFQILNNLPHSYKSFCKNISITGYSNVVTFNFIQSIIIIIIIIIMII
jgi:hypothetical protein